LTTVILTVTRRTTKRTRIITKTTIFASRYTGSGEVLSTNWSTGKLVRLSRVVRVRKTDDILLSQFCFYATTNIPPTLKILAFNLSRGLGIVLPQGG